jgi:predicted ATPase
MSRIKIRDFGPIKKGCLENDGWIDIKKVTVFIGNQGSGKSTVAKLIATFIWIEKALVRGDYKQKWFEQKGRFARQFLSYHRLENYLPSNGDDNCVIEYEGDAYSIKYEHGLLIINSNSAQAYPLPQIMYVPAERNFLAYVKTPKELKLSSPSLKEFLTEFDNAKNDLKGTEKLPVNNVHIEYDKLNDTLNIKGDGYKIKLSDASSGFQSLVPLYMVSEYLANSVKKQSESSSEPMSSDEMQRFKKGVEEIWSTESLTDEQKRVALSVLSSKFNKTAFVNIVEEPEQNLFPSSQWQMLQSIIGFNDMNSGNKLIITTHSPYIINYLSIAIQGKYIESMLMQSSKKNVLLPRLYRLIPEKALLSDDSVIVYELNEEDGVIVKLATVNGIPSDRNYLNDMLAEGNQLFDALLEVEQEL